MTIERDLACIDALLKPNRLNDVQELVFRQCWFGKSYQEIAADFDYDAGYIRVVGSRLWKELSQVLGEKITKNNFRSILRQYSQSRLTDNSSLPLGYSSNITLFTPEPEFPGGQVNLDSPFYIERPPIEAQCYREILQPGALIRIKAPKQMGKTSLLNRVLHYASTQAYCVVRLNFQQADIEALSNLHNFLKWFCKSISWKLKLEPQLDAYWDEDKGLAKSSCTRYFEEYLLKNIANPLVLGLDEIERLFSYPTIAQDFLPLLRVWYEEANEVPVWQQLRLIVIHSTEVYIPLKINQSPFNVGLPIRLPEWTQVQVQTLARFYQIPLRSSEIERLMAMVGGHPYLIQLAFYHLYHGTLNLDKLLAEAATRSGIYSTHLRRILEQLEVEPELAEALRKAIGTHQFITLEPRIVYQLQSMGLVKLIGNQVLPSCQLYRSYFQSCLS